MATNKSKAKTKVSQLSHSLDELEEKLKPFFSQSLPETLVSLDALQQAKAQVLLPYLIDDLIFIYLRTRGIDPKTHPVVAELARVRQYFDKIKDAEDPDKKRTEIDKATASRFIKHAIAQAKYGKSTMPDAVHTKFDADGNAFPAVAEGSTSRVPKRVTSKMLEREAYERELKEAGNDSDEEMLEVFDEGENDEQGVAQNRSKGKSRLDNSDPDQMTTAAVEQNAPTAGRKRRKMDPFGQLSEDEIAIDGGATPLNDTEKTTVAEEVHQSDVSSDLAVNSAYVTADGVDGSSPDKPKRRKKKNKRERDTGI